MGEDAPPLADGFGRARLKPAPKGHAPTAGKQEGVIDGRERLQKTRIRR